MLSLENSEEQIFSCVCSYSRIPSVLIEHLLSAGHPTLLPDNMMRQHNVRVCGGQVPTAQTTDVNVIVNCTRSWRDRTVSQEAEEKGCLAWTMRGTDARGSFWRKCHLRSDLRNKEALTR